MLELLDKLFLATRSFEQPKIEGHEFGPVDYV